MSVLMKKSVWAMGALLYIGCGLAENSEELPFEEEVVLEDRPTLEDEMTPEEDFEVARSAISYGDITGNTPSARPVVALRNSTDVSTPFCTGTIIADRWILTSAHCLRQCPGASNSPCPNTSNNNLVVSVARNDGRMKNVYNGPSSHFPYKTNSFAIAPREYSGSGDSSDDIGLIRLDGPQGFSAPANRSSYRMRLMKRQTWKGANFETLGWGRTKHWASDEPAIRSLRRASRKVSFAGALRFWAKANPSGNCAGDSGGPALRLSPAEPPVQFGVLSQRVGSLGSSSCPTSTGSNIWTLVGPKLDWIKDMIGGCTEGTLTNYTSIGYVQCFDDPISIPASVPTSASQMGQCSSTNKCDALEGRDCDNNSQCYGESYCHHNIGASYGLPANADLCLTYGL